MLCIKCKEQNKEVPVTFVKPSPLCDYHWTEWWTEDAFADPEEQQRFFNMTLQSVQRDTLKLNRIPA